MVWRMDISKAERDRKEGSTKPSRLLLEQWIYKSPDGFEARVSRIR